MGADYFQVLALGDHVGGRSSSVRKDTQEEKQEGEKREYVWSWAQLVQRGHGTVRHRNPTGSWI